MVERVVAVEGVVDVAFPIDAAEHRQHALRVVESWRGQVYVTDDGMRDESSEGMNGFAREPRPRHRRTVAASILLSDI